MNWQLFDALGIFLSVHSKYPVNFVLLLMTLQWLHRESCGVPNR